MLMVQVRVGLEGLDSLKAVHKDLEDMVAEEVMVAAGITKVVGLVVVVGRVRLGWWERGVITVSRRDILREVVRQSKQIIIEF